MADQPRDMQQWMRSVERRLSTALRGGQSAKAVELAQEVHRIREEVDTIEAGTSPTPAAPVELVTQTRILFRSMTGEPYGEISVDFPDVTRDVNGNDITVDRYELWSRPHVEPSPSEEGEEGEGGTPFRLVATTEASSMTHAPYEPGEMYEVKVRAVARGVAGPFSATETALIEQDTEPPSIPATLELTSSGATVTAIWNGLAEIGEEMEADFSFTEVAYGWTPEPSEVVATLTKTFTSGIFETPPRSDASDFDGTYYFRHRAVDTSGNRSAWSPVSSIRPKQLVDTGLIDEVMRGVDRELGDLNTRLINGLDGVNQNLIPLQQLTDQNKSRLDTLNTVTLPGINNSLNAVESDLSTAQGQLNTLNNTTIPGINSTLEATNSSLTTARGQINTLNNTTIPGINSTLSSVQASVNTINNTTIPGVRADLSTAQGQLSTAQESLATLRDVTVPAIRADLTSAQGTITTLNDTTLPALNERLRLARNASNLVYDPWFKDTDYTARRMSRASTHWQWVEAGNDSYFQFTPPAATTGTTNFYFAAERTTDHLIPVIPGETVRLSARVGNAGASVRLTYELLRADGTAAYSAASSYASGNNDDRVISAMLVIPAGVIAIGLALQWNVGATSARIYAGSMRVERMSDTDLFVPGSILTNHIAANAIEANNIAANAVTTAKIATGAVTANEIAALTITANELATNSVTAVKILANAVTTEKIATNAVTANEIAALTITAGNIAANAVTTAKIATNAITANELAANSVQAGHITASAVTTAKIATGAVTANEIAALTITANELATNSVTAVKILANAVTTAKIATNAVTANEIAANTIVAGNIATNAIQARHLQANSVGADQVIANSIGTGHLQARSVQVHQLQVGSFDNLFSDQQFTSYRDHSTGTNSPWVRASGNPHNMWQWENDSNVGASIVSVASGAASRMELYCGEVAPGDQMSFRIRVRKTSNADGFRIHARHRGENRATPLSSTTILGTSFSNLPTDSVWEFNWTVPNNAGIRELWIDFETLSTSTGSARYSEPYMRRRVDSQLLVDGSVLTDKLAANAVTSDKITANAITAREIAALAISAGHVQANAITADKINFGSLNGSLITGLQIQTHTTNRGVKVTNAGIRAFDSGGSETFNVDATTGSVTAAGGTFTGGTFQTSSNWASAGGAVVRQDGTLGNFAATNTSGQVTARLGGPRNELSNLAVVGPLRMGSSSAEGGLVPDQNRLRVQGRMPFDTGAGLDMFQYGLSPIFGPAPTGDFTWDVVYPEARPFSNSAPIVTCATVGSFPSVTVAVTDRETISGFQARATGIWLSGGGINNHRFRIRYVTFWRG